MPHHTIYVVCLCVLVYSGYYVGLCGSNMYLVCVSVYVCCVDSGDAMDRVIGIPHHTIYAVLYVCVCFSVCVCIVGTMWVCVDLICIYVCVPVNVCCVDSGVIMDRVIGMPRTVFEDLSLYVSVFLYMRVCR